ncbi:DUF6519 domain-containing protein [Corallococcus sp. Z5C101001]|uniref:DUF6519 domain-containing protein n=1 Tax=Corallococcus sp. Z5C101001 TaxID=2596829 RepID=UPI00117BEA38|nr:DUF6519 domain-containing protein [Corallococcus sp. Z5C101001]TSC32942.1 beta-propeller fold lactonase family protein [Corallococcus sp. Z5C101001]
MKGDFSRNTFRPAKHYSGVRMQQGRVQLDADWNEHVDIQRYLDQTTRRDVIGVSGTPQEPGTPADQTGFALFLSAGQPALRKGRYYVDGVLCENDQEPSLGAQPDLPGVPLPTANGRYLAFLDVWQRHVTALEDAELREVALGGPDTATRTRTVWQVRLYPLTGANASGPVEAVPCQTFGTPQWTPEELKSTGTLAARGEPEQASDNPCIIGAEAGYRRLENQLYRVEIHRGNPSGGKATFKWSRDNGILVTQVKSVDAADRLLVVAEPGKDGYRRFQPNQWLELTNEERVLRGEPGELVRVEAVTGNRITVDAATWPAALPAGELTVRAWDMVGGAGALEVSPAPDPSQPESGWTPLESGVQVRFTAGRYRTGDYWLIPARTVTRGVLWPKSGGLPVAEPPQGIRHHYCALGVLERGGSGWTVHDCRKLFPPLTEHKTLVYLGGDGQEVMPTQPPIAPARLARPLRAGVFNGRTPVVGARVRFNVVVPEGSGTLTDVSTPANTGASIVVLTGADGVAQVYWAPQIDGWQTVDHPLHSQTVEARLLDSGNEVVHAPLRYFASLSVASKVAYAPDTAQEILNGTHTVQEALDTLSRQLVLTYEGGDGQEAMPGEALPRPLRVGVARHQRRAANQVVRFQVRGTSNGASSGVRVTGSAQPWAQSITATTNDEGIAEVDWLPNANDATQQVEARLMVGGGANPTPVHLPLVFTASLSRADRVAYQAGGCQTLSQATTVQQALDTLCRQRTFLYLGGDGQEGTPGEELESPLVVGVMTGENPVVNALVHFQIVKPAEGARLRPLKDTSPGDTSLLVRTDEQGTASVIWRLSAQTAQKVLVTLVDDSQQPTRLPPIQFNARPGASGAAEPAVHVVQVTLPSESQYLLENDGLVNADLFQLLKQGVRITCSEELAPYRSPTGAPLPLPRPVVTLSLELLYPMTTSDYSYWQQIMGKAPGILGHQTLSVAGEARISGKNIQWVPSASAFEWMDRLRWMNVDNMSNPRMLAKLRIQGGFIHSLDGTRLLDGEATSRSLAERFAIGYPNRGDGRQGGDFELWFWIQCFVIGLAPRVSGPGGVVEVARAEGPAVLTETARRDFTSGLGQPWGLARDLKRQELLVADTGTSSVLRFSLKEKDALTPLGSHGAGVVQPTALVLDAAQDTLYVANGGEDSVAVFRRDKLGGFEQERVISGKKTGLSGPLGLALDPERKLLFVAGSGKAQVTGLTVATRAGSRTTFLTVFDANAKGDVAPRVKWTGDQLGLNRAAGLALDVSRQELFVADHGSDTVAVYSVEALLAGKEEVTPVRVLQGRATGLAQPIDVSLDASGQQLWVANAKSGTVTVYPRDAQGNTAPTRALETPGPQGQGLRAVLP